MSFSKKKLESREFQTRITLKQKSTTKTKHFLRFHICILQNICLQRTNKHVNCIKKTTQKYIQVAPFQNNWKG